MFKRLRNHFIITNMAITSIVLVIAFSSIYFVALNTTNRRPPMKIDQAIQLDSGKTITEVFEERLSKERNESLSSLLISLIVTGVSVELIVLLISIYLADQSIKPVKKAYEAQKTFIANASHEIKTPLAAIQANLEAADIEGNHWIDNVALEVEDLATLNNQLLTLARVEGEFTANKKPTEVNLELLMKRLIAPLGPRLTQKGIELNCTLSKKKVSLIKDDFKQVTNILLDNAIKYGETKITITLSDHKLKITNDGAIISKKNLPHIFDRFYQTDKSKNGVGLGLAIAKQVATKNHWTLTAASDHTTTTFTLIF